MAELKNLDAALNKLPLSEQLRREQNFVGVYAPSETSKLVTPQINKSIVAPINPNPWSHVCCEAWKALDVIEAHIKGANDPLILTAWLAIEPTLGAVVQDCLLGRDKTIDGEKLFKFQSCLNSLFSIPSQFTTLDMILALSDLSIFGNELGKKISSPDTKYFRGEGINLAVNSLRLLTQGAVGSAFMTLFTGAISYYEYSNDKDKPALRLPEGLANLARIGFYPQRSREPKADIVFNFLDPVRDLLRFGHAAEFKIGAFVKDFSIDFNVDANQKIAQLNRILEDLVEILGATRDEQHPNALETIKSDPPEIVILLDAFHKWHGEKAKQIIEEAFSAASNSLNQELSHEGSNNLKIILGVARAYIPSLVEPTEKYDPIEVCDQLATFFLVATVIEHGLNQIAEKHQDSTDWQQFLELDRYVGLPVYKGSELSSSNPALICLALASRLWKEISQESTFLPARNILSISPDNFRTGMQAMFIHYFRNVEKPASDQTARSRKYLESLKQIRIMETISAYPLAVGFAANMLQAQVQCTESSIAQERKSYEYKLPPFFTFKKSQDVSGSNTLNQLPPPKFDQKYFIGTREFEVGILPFWENKSLKQHAATADFLRLEQKKVLPRGSTAGLKVFPNFIRDTNENRTYIGCGIDKPQFYVSCQRLTPERKLSTYNLKVTTGVCLFSVPCVRVSYEDGTPGHFTNPDAPLDRRVKEITVNPKLSGSEILVTMQLTRLVRMLSDYQIFLNKSAKISVSIPTVEYYLYALDALESRRLDCKQVLGWFSAVDERSAILKNAFSKLLANEKRTVDIEWLTPLSPIVPYIQSCLNEERVPLLQEALCVCVQESQGSMVELIERRRPDSWLKLAYLSEVAGPLDEVRKDHEDSLNLLVDTALEGMIHRRLKEEIKESKLQAVAETYGMLVLEPLAFTDRDKKDKSSLLYFQEIFPMENEIANLAKHFGIREDLAKEVFLVPEA